MRTNFFDVYDQSTASCDEANQKICGYLELCEIDCSSRYVCEKETEDFNSCVLGVSCAPDECLVLCNGGISASSAKVMPLIASSILTVIVISGNGLLGSF